MTRYVVLQQDDSGFWSEITEIEAHTADQAATNAYMKNPVNVRAIVAVPKRSWRPTPIRTEVKTKVVLGEPAPTGDSQ